MLIQVDGGRGRDELQALYRWLLEDPEARKARPHLVAGTPGPGEMGAGLDLLGFAVSSGLNVAGVVVAIAAWLRPRAAATPSRARLKVVIEHDGTTVAMSNASAREVADVLAALRQG